jgi:hypothetical protein
MGAADFVNARLWHYHAGPICTKLLTAISVGRHDHSSVACRLSRAHLRRPCCSTAPHPRYFLFRAYVTSIAGQGSFLRRRRLRVRCAPACDRERVDAAVKPDSCVVTSDRPSTVSQVRNDDGARTHCAPYTGLEYAHLRVLGLRSFGELGGAFRRLWLRYLRGHHGGGASRDVGLAPAGRCR